MKRWVALVIALATAASAQEYKIGDRGPAGGIVFHDKGSTTEGWRWLEAAPSDLGPAAWNNGKNLQLETKTEVGSGEANTALIVAAQGEGRYAAKLCADLSLGGCDDWFLPSKDELELLLSVLRAKAPEEVGTGWWWSSSQAQFYESWGQSRSEGKGFTRAKGASLWIRAVRSF